jgi:hypothetical protein
MDELTGQTKRRSTIDSQEFWRCECHAPEKIFCAIPETHLTAAIYQGFRHRNI